jgi:DNA adenine methylase
MRRLPRSSSSVWINDKDYGMVCLWRAVSDAHEELIQRIEEFEPSVDKFYQFKEEDGNQKIEPVRCGFQKLALHQTSFSGLGVKAGGPIGGRSQSSRFNVNCRWNPSRLKREVVDLHALFSEFKPRLKITCLDFAKVIDGAPPHAFIYADPPYYEKGGALYKHSMDDADHRRLATSLRNCKAPWVLSYDEHQFVRGLYDWASIDSIELTYTMAVEHTARRKNSEVIITPRSEVLEAVG